MLDGSARFCVECRTVERMQRRSGRTGVVWLNQRRWESDSTAACREGAAVPHSHAHCIHVPVDHTRPHAQAALACLTQQLTSHPMPW